MKHETDRERNDRIAHECIRAAQQRDDRYDLGSDADPDELPEHPNAAARDGWIVRQRR